jgi:Histidine kinase
VRLEERVGERTRIARELHDTLLQSFQGLMLRFQVAHDELPGSPAEARKTLEYALDGRDAVQGLRSSSVETNDLATPASVASATTKKVIFLMNCPSFKPSKLDLSFGVQAGRQPELLALCD